MASRRAILALLAVVVMAGAAGPRVTADPEGASAVEEEVLVPWTNGTFVAGAAGIGVSSPVEPVPHPNMHPWSLVASGCERRLFMDLHYAPQNLTGRSGAPVEMEYTFLVTVEQDGERADIPIMRPVENRFLLELPKEGSFDLALRLRQGLAVDWGFRLVARTSLLAEGCGPGPLIAVQVAEVEADPEGSDVGREWVELLNLGSLAVDVSGWTITTTHGTTVTVTLDAGTVIPGGGRSVVGHDSQWLDNQAEQVVLRDGSGAEQDRTPTLTDTANDGRSWQRDATGWRFDPATPGT